MKWPVDFPWWVQLLLSIVVIVVGSTVSNLILGLFKLPNRVSKLETEIISFRKLFDKLPSRVTKLETEFISFKELFDKMVRPIHEFIMKNKFIRSDSPKQITDAGKALLEKHKIESFIELCPWVQDVSALKDEEELDIFLKCLEWIDENGKKKIAEIMYENEISHDQCRELLALAIRDIILHKIG